MPFPVPPHGRRFRAATRAFEVRAVAMLAIVLSIGFASARRAQSTAVGPDIARYGEARWSRDGEWRPVTTPGEEAMTAEELLIASQRLDVVPTPRKNEHEAVVCCWRLAGRKTPSSG